VLRSTIPNCEAATDSGLIGLLKLTIRRTFRPTPVEPLTGLNAVTVGPVVSLAEPAVNVAVPGFVSALPAKSVSWEL